MADSFRSTCPSCNRGLTVPNARVGQQVKCPACTKVFMATPTVATSTSSSPLDEIAPDESIVRPITTTIEDSDTKKTIKLLAWLIGGSASAVAAIIAIIAGIQYANAPKPSTPAKTEATIDTKNKSPIEIAMDKDLDAMRRRDRSSVIDVADAVSFLAMGFVFVGFLYLVAIAMGGVYIAHDSTRRGMSGVGWCAFYFSFHAAWKAVSAGLYTVLIASTIATRSLPLTILGLVLLEAFSWSGLISYLAGRRPGTLTVCPNCKVKTLAYVEPCPVCGKY